jgi:SOS response associated peptidase (SRAP)
VRRHTTRPCQQCEPVLRSGACVAATCSHCRSRHCASCSCSSRGRISCRAITSHRPRCADRTPDAQRRGPRADHGALGLVPFWADDLSIGNRLINARCETVHTLRAFREAFSRRRCLVPADGFFEWQTTTQDPVRMIPKRENGESGICERHERVDSRPETTTPLRRMHSRS